MIALTIFFIMLLFTPIYNKINERACPTEDQWQMKAFQ